MLLHPQVGYKDALGEYLVGTSSEGGQITNYGFTLVTASDPDTNATIWVLVAVPEPDRLAGSGAERCASSSSWRASWTRS